MATDADFEWLSHVQAWSLPRPPSPVPAPPAPRAPPGGPLLSNTGFANDALTSDAARAAQWTLALAVSGSVLCCCLLLCICLLRARYAPEKQYDVTTSTGLWQLRLVGPVVGVAPEVTLRASKSRDVVVRWERNQDAGR